MRGVLAVSWLGGFALALNQLAPKASDRFPLGAAIVACLLIGPLVTFAMVFVESLLTAVIGRLLGGEATDVELRAALAWAQAPLLWLLLITWLPVGAGLPAQLLGLAVILWSEALAGVLIAEIQGFSVRRAFATILLAWIVKIGFLVTVVVLAPHDDRPAKEPAGVSTVE